MTMIKLNQNLPKDVNFTECNGLWSSQRPPDSVVFKFSKFISTLKKCHLFSIEAKLACKKNSKLFDHWSSAYNLLVQILDPKIDDGGLALAQNLVAFLRNFRPLSDDNFVILRQQLDRMGKI